MPSLPTMSPSTSSPFNYPHSSVELNDEWFNEPTLLQAITNKSGFPSLVALTIPVGSKTLEEFFNYLSLCPNLRELTVRPLEDDEIYDCTLAETDGWAWGALVPNLECVMAPALLIGKLVPGRAVHTVGIIQEEREDSDAMLQHNLDALENATLSTIPVENVVLEDISVPFMRPLLAKIADTFPALRKLRLGTDAMDDMNDPDEKYQYGNIPDETYEVSSVREYTCWHGTNYCVFEPLFRLSLQIWCRASFAFLQR
jgi:hypothetical protein